MGAYTLSDLPPTNKTKFSSPSDFNPEVTFAFAIVANAVESINIYMNRRSNKQWRQNKEFANLRRYRKNIVNDAVLADMWLQGLHESRISFDFIMEATGQLKADFLRRLYDQWPEDEIEKLRGSAAYQAVQCFVNTQIAPDKELMQEVDQELFEGESNDLPEPGELAQQYRRHINRVLDVRRAKPTCCDRS